MDIERETWHDTQSRIERLRDKFGEFELEQAEVENDPEFFDHGLELARAGWRGDAGAIVKDQEDRVLMIRHEGAPAKWGPPGGGHEPGETMEETALREVQEETGIDCDLVDVNYARRKTIFLDGDPDQRYHMLTVLFDGEYRGGSIETSDEEVLEATWFEELPENTSEFV